MKTRKLIEQAILQAIESLSLYIRMGTDDDGAAAQNIKTLAEAYDLVHRGNGGEWEC